jgi:hypothetical protein
LSRSGGNNRRRWLGLTLQQCSRSAGLGHLAPAEADVLSDGFRSPPPFALAANQARPRRKPPLVRFGGAGSRVDRPTPSCASLCRWPGCSASRWSLRTCCLCWRASRQHREFRQTQSRPINGLQAQDEFQCRKIGISGLSESTQAAPASSLSDFIPGSVSLATGNAQPRREMEDPHQRVHESHAGKSGGDRRWHGVAEG